MSYSQRRQLGQVIYASGAHPPTAIDQAMPVLVVGGGLAVLGGLFWLHNWQRKKLKEGLGEGRGEAASLGLSLLTGI